MIEPNDKVTLSDKQEQTLKEFDSFSDPEDKLEYEYTDDLHEVAGVPGELWLVLHRGIKWDNERVIYVLDVDGKLEIL